MTLTCRLLSRAHLHALFIKNKVEIDQNRPKHLGIGAQHLKTESRAPLCVVQPNTEFNLHCVSDLVE